MKDATVLIIEDEIPLEQVVKRKLEDFGLNCVSARSVDQAMDLLSEISVGAIWLDHYLLGNQDGLDFLTKFKQHKKYKKIPIFVVSNTASDEKIKSYIAFGVSKYYVKSNYTLKQITKDFIKAIRNNE